MHDLRHNYASVLAAAAYSLPLIGALLGHSQPATTARYAHLQDSPLRLAAEAAANLIVPPKPKPADRRQVRGKVVRKQVREYSNGAAK